LVLPLLLLLMMMMLPFQVDVPVFLDGGKVQIMQQTVPQLTKPTVLKIQQAALAAASAEIQQAAARLRTVGRGSGFVHPGTCLGPVEVAAMQTRVRNGVEPQATAKDVLLTGGPCMGFRRFGEGWQQHVANSKAV
jgi:hypothetical protein